MAISAAWGVGSCLAFLINCRADTLLTLDNIEQCPNQVQNNPAIPPQRSHHQTADQRAACRIYDGL